MSLDESQVILITKMKDVTETSKSDILTALADVDWVKVAGLSMVFGKCYSR